MISLSEEKNIQNLGYGLIAGIDEAGRGPLAGPVVAACVVMGSDFTVSDELTKIKDSKKLSANIREELTQTINSKFLEVGVGFCDAETIDRVNILQATFLAMKKAVGALKNKPSYLLLDGNHTIPNFSYKQKAIIKGDDSVLLIAAASIIAKVRRDKIMEEYHKIYPQYNFKKHKGYGTKEHIELLKKYGPCKIHRKSFAPVKRLI